MSEKKKKGSKTVFKRILKEVRPFRKFFILTLILAVVLAAVSVTKPKLIGWGVHEFIQTSKDAEGLLFWFFILVGVIILEGVFTFLVTYYSNLVGQSVIKELRTKLYKHMIRFKMKYFDKTPNGLVITRIVSDIEAIQEVFSNGLLSIFSDLLKLVLALTLMFYTNWQFSLMILIPIPLMIFATKIFARVIKKSLQQERLQVSKLNTFVQEHVTGMAVVQIFNVGKREMSKFENINKDHRDAHLKMVNAYSIFFPIVELFSALSIILLLFWAILKINPEVFPPDQAIKQVVEFIFFVNMIYRPMRQMADKFNTIQRGTVRAERVFEVLDEDESIPVRGDRSDVDFEQEISFNNLSFAYVDDKNVLSNFSLKIKPSEKVAFVGATGSGKTTVVNLLSRFYDYNEGSIKIGNIELKDISIKALRNNIGIVIQDVFLFSDSILNNITLRDESISKEVVIEASKAVGAHKFIMNLPGGYDFVVSERGESLSVGQRQLISFIRAYVYNPKILILDEATSSIDSESEELIQIATEKLTEGRTSIIIAHRLSTIQASDKIVVVEKGQIIEEGSHDELLAKGGHYKLLYDLQVK
jgi:ATP-binding cassette subfamily B protein